MALRAGDSHGQSALSKMVSSGHACWRCMHMCTLSQLIVMQQAAGSRQVRHLSGKTPNLSRPATRHAGDDQRLGGVALRQDERARLAAAPARVVGVVQLGQACKQQFS